MWKLVKILVFFSGSGYNQKMEGKWMEFRVKAGGLLKKYKCYVTLLLIIVNVFIFARMFWGRPTLYESQAIMQKNGAILIQGGSLKSGNASLLKAMFLHFNMEHLLNNMVVLLLIGSTVERYLGSVSFAIVYFIGGIGGNIASAWNYIKKGTAVMAAGASGAVFAVIGAMLCLVIFYSGKLEDITTKRVVAFIVLGLLNGFTSEGIDNYAHVGGLVIGFFTCLVCCLVKLSLERSSRIG